MAVRRPSYYFQIDRLKPHPDAPPRMTEGHRWAPSREHENHIKTGGDVFYHNGKKTRVVPTLPNGCRPYHVYSIYHAFAEIWAVPFDISMHDAGQSGSDDGGDGYPEWRTLSFAQIAQDRDRISYAGLGLEHERLRVRREDQHWIDHLLPGAHTPAPESWHLPSRPNGIDTRAGGLVGELPLLLGLAALMMPADKVREYLPAVVRAPSWQINEETPWRKHSGWDDRRGVVVTVSTEPGPPVQVESEKRLRSYERGKLGKILL